MDVINYSYSNLQLLQCKYRYPSHGTLLIFTCHWNHLEPGDLHMHERISQVIRWIRQHKDQNRTELDCHIKIKVSTKRHCKLPMIKNAMNRTGPTVPSDGLVPYSIVGRHLKM